MTLMQNKKPLGDGRATRLSLRVRNARRGLLILLVALFTILPGANLLVEPVHAKGSGIAVPVAKIAARVARPRFVVPQPIARAPKSDAAAYRAAAMGALAAGASSILTLDAPAPPTAADLAQTDEVVLTPAIRALATTLGNNPVQIYNYVRDHVVYTPTYGSIQGGDATLQTLRGNDFDQASLVIALLRAANMPARYVYGTIEVPLALAENWVGGVSSSDAAVSLFAQGGVPVQAVLSGGKVSALRVEHVWVEAYVDFAPSRGSVNRSAKAWVPIDASFKQYRYQGGMAVANDVSVDVATLGTQIKQGATIAADSVLGLNVSPLASSYNDFAGRVASYISAHKTNATVGDVLGTRATIVEGFPLLAGSLPYTLVAIGSRYASVPDALRWKIQYGVFASEYDRSQNNAIASVSESLPKLTGARITLSFAGASSGDSARLAALLNTSTLPASLPGAQVHLAASLTVDGGVVASGGNVLLGTALVGGVGIFDPRAGDWTYTASDRVVAGETHSLSADGNGVALVTLGQSRDKLSAMSTQIAAHQYAALTQDALVGETLNYAAHAYAATVAGTAELQCRACGIVGYPLPIVVTAHTNAAVTYVAGVPQTVSFPGVALSVQMLGRTAVTVDNNVQRALLFQRSFGQHASAYGHLLLDAIFTDANHPGRTASTIRALDAADAANLAIFSVTAANSAAILPQLGVDTLALNAVKDATQAGNLATISQSDVAVGSWNGAGYVLEDPASGSGDYEVNGGESAVLDVSGGWLPLAFAGTGLSVQPSAVSTAIGGILSAEVGYYGAAAALLGDYGAVAWSTFVGASTVVSQWWLCALGNGLPTVLGDPGSILVTAIGVDTHTDLTGVPQPNNPPYFTSAPHTSGAIGQVYQYFATAVDPDGDLLTFSRVRGPSGLSVAANGLVSWTSPLTGSYPVTVRVSDGKANVDQSYTLTIGQVMPLDMTLVIAPQFVNDGDTVTINVASSGGSGAVTKSLQVDGAAVALDATGQAKVIAHNPGAHPVVAVATDSNGSITHNGVFGVHVASDVAAPVVSISSPADGDTLTAPTQVTGTVSDDNLLFWQLLSSPAGAQQWTELARGTHNINGALATFDPTLLSNGQYDLNLIATDVNGQQSSQVISVIVFGNLKLGQFTVSFDDLNIAVGGLPLIVTRTYDSRKKDQLGDFGYGWNLGYQNVQLQRNRPLGENWEFYQPNFLTFCIRPIGKRVVSVALANGTVQQFDVAASPDCDVGQVPEVISMAFNARAGTTSTLEILDGGDELYQGGTVFDPDTALPFDSVQYKLTTLENYQYILTSGDGAQTFQIVQITDPNGETLSIGPQGVVSSSGAAIQFVRDAAGRIAKVVDPANRTVNYAYTAAGDLDSITNPLNQVSRNQYATVPASFAHLLTSYTDPAGAQQWRNEYDDGGKLIAEYDALGNKVDISARNVDTHTQSVTDRRGNVTTYVFDDAGNITRKTDALGNVSTATFDAYGNRLSQRDPLGRTTTTSYDAASGTVLTRTDVLGNTTTSAWNFYSMMGNHTPQALQSTTDALGNVTSYGYTDPGMLRTITDPLGHATSLAWGGSDFDQLSQLRDATGNLTTYQNDAHGRKIQETDPLGNITKYTYDDAGHLTSTSKSRVVPGGTELVVTSQTFDANGNRLTQVDPLGNVTQNIWNAQKKLTAQTDPLGRTTRYAYDPIGQMTNATYADGSSDGIAYDANGNPIATTDRAGRITATTYDALNRPTVITYPDNARSAVTYDSAGQVTQTSDELNRVTSFQYDAAGRATGSIDARGNASTFAYDAVGKLLQTTDALGNRTGFTYDAAYRKNQATWPNGGVSTYGYDAAGRKTQETDPVGRVVQFAYDGLGRLRQVIDALGKVTVYARDEFGRRIAQTDALSRLTQWAYDSAGRMTSHTLPDNRYETMAYDAVGRLIMSTDFAGLARAFQYDSSDRVTKQLFADGSVVAASYTASGQVASLTDTQSGVSQVIRYTSDRRDRPTDIVNPDGSALHYVYDAAGQRTKLTIVTPDGASTSVSFTYDQMGNLATVSSNGRTFAYKYDATNRKIERDDPNGVVTKYSRDGGGHLVDWVVTQGSSSGAPILAKGDYVLNPAGQRMSLAYQAADGQTRNIAYTYDGAGSLSHEHRSLPAHDTDWTIDAVGNRSTSNQDGQVRNFTFDSTDRLTAISGANATAYSWDQNGQLAAKTQGAAQTTYAFDARHELIGATLADNTKIAYRYAADGNIAQKTTTPPVGAAQSTHYLVDPNLAYAQVVAEYDDNGHATAIYIYGDELLLRLRSAQGTVYHADGMRSVTMLTDDSGTPLQTYGYDAWGNLVESTGTDSNPYAFAGERFDGDLGMIFLRARWYDPVVGRFVSSDDRSGQASHPITANKYLYANSDPVNNLDPSGAFSIGEEVAVEEDVGILDTISESLPRVAGQKAGQSIIVAILKKVAIALAVGSAGYVEVELYKRDEDRSLPVIVYGKNLDKATEHYEDAIDFGYGAGLARKSPPNPGGWYNYKPECKGITGRASGLDCDEYPFASTEQGGSQNYPRVSLRPVIAAQNQAAGRLLGTFYGACGISTDSASDDKWFGVVADVTIPTSFFVCAGRK